MTQISFFIVKLYDKSMSFKITQPVGIGLGCIAPSVRGGGDSLKMVENHL